MAFGQPAGPPASPRQLEELLALLELAGHSGFRDARGPLGLNQRQAAGRFTRVEATALIEQLEQSSGPGRDAGGAGASRDATIVGPDRAGPDRAAPTAAALRVLRDVPSGHLAAELQRRGWLVLEP